MDHPLNAVESIGSAMRPLLLFIRRDTLDLTVMESRT